MNTNFRNTLNSIAIIVTIILLVYFIMVYPSTNRISVIWLYFLYYAAFVTSIIAAIYYFWNYKADSAKFKNSLEYNFVGTLNCAVGIIGFLVIMLMLAL